MWTPSFDPLEALNNLERGQHALRFDINQLAQAYNSQNDTVRHLVEALNTVRNAMELQHQRILELEQKIKEIRQE